MTTSPLGEEPRRPSDAARRSGPALEAMFRFIVWLIPTLDKLPRSQKFLLGDRMQATALDVFERLIEATYSKARERPLIDANLGLEKLRFLLRVCAELHYLDYSGCGTFRRVWRVVSGAAGADAGIMWQVAGLDARAASGRGVGQHFHQLPSPGCSRLGRPAGGRFAA